MADQLPAPLDHSAFDDSDLRGYLQAKHERNTAWLDATPDGEFRAAWTCPDIDKELAYQASHGVTTVTAFVVDELLGEYSDAYKDVYGVRPTIPEELLNIPALTKAIADLAAVEVG
jgi:hypothetical protein